MSRPSSDWVENLQFVLRHNAQLFADAADHPSKLGALIVYLTDLRAMLERVLDDGSGDMVAPINKLTMELGRLQAKQNSQLLKVADRAGTPLSTSDHVLRAYAVIGVRILRRAGYTRPKAQKRVADLLNERGFQSRKGNGLRDALIGKWVDQATPSGTLSGIVEEERRFFANGFLERPTEAEADAAAKYLIDRLPVEEEAAT